MPLRRAIVGCHLALIAAVAVSLVPPASALRLGAAVLLAAPLLLTLRGVARGRRAALQATAVLLVAYVGGLSVEVVARWGDALSESIALLAAALELGLILALIRRSARSAP